MSEPKEKPILMSAMMVQALLAGRKTQTRRLVKNRSALEALAPDMFTPEYVALSENDYCPYGKPGDRLWVRETFRPETDWVEGHTSHQFDIRYAADVTENLPQGSQRWCAVPVEQRSHYTNRYIGSIDGGDKRRWHPAIHMPRWASRITLEITEVRVQRLQDIGEADCISEGIGQMDGGVYRGRSDSGLVTPWLTAREAFRDLWESINGHGSWERNEWVWAVSFKVVQP